MGIPESIPHILDVQVVAGAQATGTPQLVIELPHGATDFAHYQYHSEQLVGEVPENPQEIF